MIDNVLIHHLEHNIPIHINEWNRLRELIKSAPDQVTEKTLLLAIELSVSMTIQTSAHLMPVGSTGFENGHIFENVKEEEFTIYSKYIHAIQIPWEVVEAILQTIQYQIRSRVGHLMHLLLLRNGISNQVFMNWVQETKWQGSGTACEILGGEDSCFLTNGDGDIRHSSTNGRQYRLLPRGNFDEIASPGDFFNNHINFDEDKMRILLRKFPNLCPHILHGAIQTQQHPTMMKLIIEEGFLGTITGSIHQWRKYLINESGKLLRAIVRKGRVDVIELFLTRDPPLINKSDVQSFELLRMLVEGANANAYRLDHQQHLQHLHRLDQPTFWSHTDFISLARLLIELDPKALETRATDWRGSDSIPLHFICQGRCVKLFKVFVEEGVRRGISSRGGLLMTNRYNLNCLEMVLSNDFRGPGKTYQILMYLIETGLLKKSDVVHFQLLHRVVQHRGPDFEKSALALLSLAPEAIYASNDLGNFPTHSTIVDRFPSRRITFASINPNMLALLLQEGLHKGNITQYDSFGGLLVPNKVGETTLDLIMRFGREMETGEIVNFEGCNVKFWQCLDLCWNRTNKLPLLQAAAFVVSSARLRTIIKRYDCINNTDEHGNHPLHFALERRRSFVTSSSIFSSSCIRDILNANPNAASKKNAMGQLPLHIALQGTRGCFDWNNVIQPILNASYEAIDESDPSTGLYPFILAATSKGHIESTYYLLRQSPQLLISHL